MVLNMILAPYMLGEKLHLFPDAAATVTILIGCVITTMSGDHSEAFALTAEELVALMVKPVFISSMAPLGFLVTSVLGYMHFQRAEIERLARERPGTPFLPHVLLPALVSSGSDALTNIALKGVGEL